MSSQMTVDVGGTSQYSSDIRRRAIAEYVVSGNRKQVALALGVPRCTVQDWVRSEWGQELINSIRRENQDSMISRYSSIVQSALDRTSERLEQGDYLGVNEDGETLYKPVSARDSIMIAAISTDKMRLLSNQATSITATDGALVKISEQLAAYAKDQQAKVIDGHVVSHSDNVSD